MTIQNEQTRQLIQVDVVRRCGARGVGDPLIYQEMVFLDAGLRITYPTNCKVQIMLADSQVSCSGCD